MIEKCNIWDLETCMNGKIPHVVKPLFQDVTPYILNFLTSSHPYRKGVMCPFMPKAISNNNVYFSHYQNSEDIIKNSINFFKNTDESFKTIIILFDKQFSIEKLLKLHIKYKVECVKEHIMMGALYSTSDASSLHNEKYYPLRTPNPILVLRNMTSSDLIFLTPTHHSYIEKIKFLNSYIKKYKHKNNHTIKQQVYEAKIKRNIFVTKLILKFIFLPILLIFTLWFSI